VEFVNTFTVPVGADQAFEILTDLERVAPCLPGATLEEVDGAAYTGKVKVKVGPIAVTYRGTAEITEKDADAKHAVIHAAGRESRGAGTATADVAADLTERPDGSTEVTVTTDLTITGKPAQFGRGVMADVGAKLIDTFADRLREMIEDDQAGRSGADVTTELPPATAAPEAGAPPISAAAPASAAAAPAVAAGPGTGAPAAADSGPRRIAPPAQEPEALDLFDVAGGAITKRLVPVAVVALLALLLVWWVRRDR
jgi:uncharacterized protein